MLYTTVKILQCRVKQILVYSMITDIKYQGADKSLAWPGRKQVWKHVRDVRDFKNIEMQTVKFFSPARQGPKGNSHHSDKH